MRAVERQVLERAIQRVTEQAANANAIVGEAIDAGLAGSEPLVVNLKMLHAELLSVKSDLERELEKSFSTASSAAFRRTMWAASAFERATGHAPRRHRTKRPRSRSDSTRPALPRLPTGWTNMSATKEVVVASSEWQKRFSWFADRVGRWTGASRSSSS
jgi:hypothetical protein